MFITKGKQYDLIFCELSLNTWTKPLYFLAHGSNEKHYIWALWGRVICWDVTSFVSSRTRTRLGTCRVTSFIGSLLVCGSLQDLICQEFSLRPWSLNLSTCQEKLMWALVIQSSISIVLFMLLESAHSKCTDFLQPVLCSLRWSILGLCANLAQKT